LVNRQADPEEFAIYHVIRDQRLLYVVIYGVFSSAGAAQRVADQLPGELGSVAAWVRQLDLVQDTVRSTATTDVLAQSDRG
jgi:septal ring-binding cell division protein DamX